MKGLRICAHGFFPNVDQLGNYEAKISYILFIHKILAFNQRWYGNRLVITHAHALNKKNRQIMPESSKYSFKISLKLWETSFGAAMSSRSIARHFDKRWIAYGQFSAKYLKICRGISGISPADFKFRHLSWLFCKNYENRTVGTPDFLIWNL